MRQSVHVVVQYGSLHCCWQSFSKPLKTRVVDENVASPSAVVTLTVSLK